MGLSPDNTSIGTVPGLATNPSRVGLCWMSFPARRRSPRGDIVPITHNPGHRNHPFGVASASQCTHRAGRTASGCLNAACSRCVRV